MTKPIPTRILPTFEDLRDTSYRRLIEGELTLDRATHMANGWRTAGHEGLAVAIEDAIRGASGETI